MNKQISIAFLLLVLAQTFHSVEEYFGKLWEEYAPARFICLLISPDAEKGFLIIDSLLILFGLWCWWFPVRKNYSYATGLVWGWVFMETLNGIGHIIWTLIEGRYTPGVATAPIILFLTIYLARQLILSKKMSANIH